MFGYVTLDKSNIFRKDYDAYRAFYCGMCKCSGKLFGQLSRFTVNYDITFISIMLHSVLNLEANIGNETCILSPIKKKPVVKTDGIMRKSAYLNMLFADFKFKDDLADSGSLKMRAAHALLKRKIEKARTELPRIAALLDEARKEQDIAERACTPSPDRAAHPFAELIRGVFKELTGDKYSEGLGMLAYQLGRFVYFADAVDDYDKDIIEGQYNPLIYAFPGIKNKAELLKLRKEDVRMLLLSATGEIRRCYQDMDLKVAEGVITHVLWYGLANTVRRLIEPSGKCLNPAGAATEERL